MPEPTPEAWAQIRHAYEHTGKPLAHICAEHGVTIPTVRYRMKCWEWKRRKPLIPREGPPPVDMPSSADTFLHPPLEGEGRRFERQRKPAGWGEAGEFADHPTPLRLADASRSDPPPQEPAPGRAQARPGWEGEEAIVPRLQGAVAHVLQAIEATIARLAAEPHHAREMEQAGRALSSLTRTLRELSALLAQHKAATDDDEVPVDMDAFRKDLTRRLRGLVEEEKQREREAKPGET